ncbi:hypothetical protein Mapa_014992 [Marchantia paleacea]|nr:hypothetical protein Mapa_014992 [Marchantia paleacea]
MNKLTESASIWMFLPTQSSKLCAKLRRPAENQAMALTFGASVSCCIIPCTVLSEAPGTKRSDALHRRAFFRTAARRSCRFKTRNGMGFVHANMSFIASQPTTHQSTNVTSYHHT